MKTIKEAAEAYLDSVKLSRSINTALTYRHAINFYIRVLEVHNIDIQTTPVTQLNEDTLIWFANDLKVFSTATERLYLTAISGFFEFISAENLSVINLPRVHILIRQRARRPGQRLPQFPEQSIDIIINAMINREY